MLKNILIGFNSEMEKTASIFGKKRREFSQLDKLPLQERVKLTNYLNRAKDFSSKYNIPIPSITLSGRPKGSNYAPFLNHINLGNNATESTLYHELGHAEDFFNANPIRQRLYDMSVIGRIKHPKLSKAILPISYLGTGALVVPKKTRKYAPVLPWIASAPKLYSEAKASYTAIRHMANIAEKGQKTKDIGRGLKRLLPAFGSYAIPPTILSLGVYTIGKIFDKMDEEYENQKLQLEKKSSIKMEKTAFFKELWSKWFGKKEPISQDSRAKDYAPGLPEKGKIDGFSRDLKQDMWHNRDKYIGRVAKVTAIKKVEKSGALFQPAFTGEWHIEKGKIL